MRAGDELSRDLIHEKGATRLQAEACGCLGVADKHGIRRTARLRVVPFRGWRDLIEGSLTSVDVVTVTASRNSRIVADRASLYVVVEGTAETAPDAVARVETKLKAVSAALKGFGSRQEVDAPIAQALGAHLGALVDVSTSGGNPGFQGQNTLSFDNRFTQPTMPPEIAINTSVTVRYRLIH